MAALTIRDDALWTKHIADPALRTRVGRLRPGDPVRLVVDGHPILFRKMKDGKDGRPTPGLKADPADVQGCSTWAELQSRRGETVTVSLDDIAPPPVDPYLAYLDTLFWEWNTQGDADAFDDL